MKVIFTLGSPAIGGGTNVIFEHATRMAKEGEQVYIVTDRTIKPEEYAWHTSAHLLNWVTYDEIENMEFDMAIATWWRTVYETYRIKAKHYVYFVQSIESRFYKEDEIGLKMLAEMTYFLDMKVITEATWIKEYLEKYGVDAYLVHNGIRKDIFTLEGDTYEKCNGLRVLVEGPVDVAFKNVPKTIKLVNQSEADEVWLLTSSDIKNYEGVDRVFSKVPPAECAKIYRSCDVIVKLSYVEGMFGPPLEMFHCGGTAIVYDVTGHDEYIVHEKNGLVAKTDDDEKVIEYINELKDKKKLKKLKEEAVKTANNWVSWEQSSENFYKTVKKLNKMESVSQEVLETKSKFFFNIYVQYENKNLSIKRQIGDRLRSKYPRVYKMYRKIIRR
jgi:glycosyltransferase involved in cell wall biosynthesis